MSYYITTPYSYYAYFLNDNYLKYLKFVRLLIIMYSLGHDQNFIFCSLHASKSCNFFFFTNLVLLEHR